MAGAFLIVGAALLAGILVIPIFQIVAVGFLFAFVFYIPIQKMASRSPKRFGLFLAIFYALIIILLGLLAYALLSNFASGLQGLSAQLDEASARLKAAPGAFGDQLLGNVADTAVVLAKGLGAVAFGFVGTIAVAGTGFVLSLMLLLNMHRARGFLAEWIPPRYRDEIAQILLNLDAIWVGYVSAQVIYGAVVGIGSFVEYELLGVPYPFVMAVLTGVLTPIPTIGGLLASLLVAVPCLLFGSTVFVSMTNGTFTLLVYLLNVAITQLSYYFVALPIVGKLSRLPTVLVFIGVTAGMAAGNILLAFLITPILSTFMLVGKYTLSKILRMDQVPGQVRVEAVQPGFFSQLLLK